MVNIQPATPERKQHQCRKCGKPIFWHKSAKTGNNYPTDSPTDRRAFHKCEAPEPQPTTAEKPLTPSYFDPEPTIEERVAALETQVAQLTRTVQSVEARQPITAEDVGF